MSLKNFGFNTEHLIITTRSDLSSGSPSEISCIENFHDKSLSQAEQDLICYILTKTVIYGSALGNM